jgi:hypothetical protein
MRERSTQWIDEKPVRLAVIFAILALLMAIASVEAWLDPDYAGGREDRRDAGKFVAPVFSFLLAWGALKLWRERDD